MSPDTFEIERDLVRWSRGQWLLVTAAVILIQAGAFLMMREPSPRPAPAVAEPELSFVRESSVSEPLALEDPTLFAGASSRGFSGLAWMAKRPTVTAEDAPLPAPSFLTFTDARGVETELRPDFTVATHTRTSPEPAPTQARPVERPRSRSLLMADSLPEIRVQPPLPVQFATDAVRPTVVEVLVDDDGSVFSTRVQTSSGSKTADNDALTLSKKVRFAPRRNTQVPAPMVIGELIFDWKVVAPGATNQTVH